MASIRAIVTLVLALPLGLATLVAAQPVSGPEFIDLTPCRILDTRGGAPLPGGMVRDVQITGACNVPTNVIVTAAALNFTIVTPTAAGHLTVFPKNGMAPLASLVNYVAGETVANAVDIGLGTGGQISVQPLTTTHLIIDVYGYFTDVEELAGRNTAVGFNALLSNTTGVNNTAVGFQALLSNTTGFQNTATGFQALVSNTTGFQNTATGDNALASNTLGLQNTATGVNALASNTRGSFNTATGLIALFNNTTGFNNTATGQGALANNTTAGNNTATGHNALFNNTTGTNNTATGLNALVSNTTGLQNTATGLNALFNNTTGSGNTAIGNNAGFAVTTGNNNVHIGNVGAAADSGLIRIGSNQVGTFIAGIFGQAVGAGGTQVFVDSSGKLGTALPSTRRVKDRIYDMGESSAGVLKLRPVTFRYKLEHDDGARRLQYGLIAEEVAEIYPELVTTNAQGDPTGVRYHVLPAMLLNELQRQQREIVELRARVQEIDELRAQVRALIGGKAAVRE